MIVVASAPVPRRRRRLATCIVYDNEDLPPSAHPEGRCDFLFQAEPVNRRFKRRVKQQIVETIDGSLATSASIGFHRGCIYGFIAGRSCRDALLTCESIGLGSAQVVCGCSSSDGVL